MPDFTLPRSLNRRLLLALAGFHCRDGTWVCACGHESVSEEQVDTMPPRAWARFVRGWLSSVTAAN